MSRTSHACLENAESKLIRSILRNASMTEQANVRLEGLSSAVDRNQSSRFRRTCGLFVAEWHDNGIESKPETASRFDFISLLLSYRIFHELRCVQFPQSYVTFLSLFGAPHWPPPAFSRESSVPRQTVSFY